jgi:hypothetical protein
MKEMKGGYAMRRLVAAGLLFSIAVFAAWPLVAQTCDYVDIGDPASEAGHNLQHWGPIEPATSGGYYGGIDNCRPIWAPEDDDNWATIDLDFGSNAQACKRLVIHHLDGQAKDSYDVYIGGLLIYSYPGDDSTDEIWLETTTTVVMTGIQTVKFVSTQEKWPGWETYGQMCFDILMVEECPVDCCNLDLVDVGDPASESGHNMTGWGPIEPATSGGNYGGIDNCRPIYAPEDNDDWATIDLDFGSNELASKCLTLHHLDGLTKDAFEAYLYPQGDPDHAKLIYTYLGDDLSSEIWRCTSVQVFGTGIQTLKLVSTAPKWPHWDTYGQMCFDIIRVDECPAYSDLVDVGDPASEDGHNMQDWGPIEPATSGGSYGGVDNCRPIYAPEDNNRWATIDLDFGCCEGIKCLTMQHLEGLATNDAFEVYIYPPDTPRPATPVFTWAGDDASVEYWLTSGVLVDFTGIKTVEFYSTEPEWPGWGTYGQVCFDTLMVSPYTPVRDMVDIGKPESEAGHNLQHWGPIEPETSGGNYGGIDDCRPVYAPEDNDNWASLEMDFGFCSCESMVLTLQHLDGIAKDAFELYIYPVGSSRPDTPDYVYAGDCYTSEIWYETKVGVTATGRQVVELVSTEDPWYGWETYGQMCFNLIKVECGEPCSPTPLCGPGVAGIDRPEQQAEVGGFTSVLPNPFNASTSIQFMLVRDSQAQLSVYDTQGRVVRTIVNEFLPAQEHSYTWDGADASGQQVASGIYFLRLRIGNEATRGRKVLLIR